MSVSHKLAAVVDGHVPPTVAGLVHPIEWSVCRLGSAGGCVGPCGVGFSGAGRGCWMVAFAGGFAGAICVSARVARESGGSVGAVWVSARVVHECVTQVGRSREWACAAHGYRFGASH